MDVRDTGYAGRLRRLDRHGGALAERAVEYQLPPLRERVQQAALTHIGFEIAIGRVQRPGNDAMDLTLARFAKVDEHDIGPAA